MHSQRTKRFKSKRVIEVGVKMGKVKKVTTKKCDTHLKVKRMHSGAHGRRRRRREEKNLQKILKICKKIFLATIRILLIIINAKTNIFFP